MPSRKSSPVYKIRIAAAVALVLGAASASAETFHASTFATGAAVGATKPDSIALTAHSVWVSYTNGADSAGSGGNSTVVRYRLNGSIRKVYSIAGSVDGLKVDPSFGLVWALQNQDGNSTLTLIDTEEQTVSQPIPYAVKSSARGIDDVAFIGGKAFVSYTNPSGPNDPTIELVQEDSNPVVLKPILYAGATGTNLATGMTHQPTPQTDPDSLKSTPEGDLMLSSGADGALVFVDDPGSAKQEVSFLQLVDQARNPVPGIDDAIFATARKGTFFLADTGNNRIVKIEAKGLHAGALYVSAEGLNAFARVDRKTGVVTPVRGVSGLKAPHGVEFMAAEEEEVEDMAGATKQ